MLGLETLVARLPDGFCMDKSRAAKNHPDSSQPSTEKNMPRIEAALRELVWRIDHVRTVLRDPAVSIEPEEIHALLDTACARSALGIKDDGVADPAADALQPEEAHDR